MPGHLKQTAHHKGKSGNKTKGPGKQKKKNFNAKPQSKMKK